MKRIRCFLPIIFTFIFLLGISLNAYTETKGVIAFAGSDTEICGSTYTLTGNNPAPGSGIWTIVSGTCIIVDNTLCNSQITDIDAGSSVTLRWSVTDGGTTFDEVTITNNTPTTAVVGSDQNLCANSTVITGILPTIGTGVWSVEAGYGIFDNSLNSTASVTDIGIGINVYRWSIIKGICSSTDNIIITNSSVSAIVGSDMPVCSTTGYLSGNNPVSGTGIWSKISAGPSTIITNPALYNSEVTGLNTGGNKFRWTITEGICSAYAEVILTNNFYPAVANVAGSSTICTDNTYLIANLPTFGTVGTWSVLAGSGNFNNENDPNAKVSGLAWGSNTVRWTISKDGCENYNDILIINNSLSAIAGSVVITCGENVSLTANSPFSGASGTWSLLSGSGLISVPDFLSPERIIVSNVGSGANIFRWSITRLGCSDYDDVVISNNSFVTSAGLDKIICAATTTLSASDPSPGTGLWTVESGTATILSPTSVNTAVSGFNDNSTSSFRWTVTKNGCTASNVINVTNDLIQAFAGADQDVCDTVAILAAQIPTSGVGMWTISGGGGVVYAPLANNSKITGFAQGINTIKWTVVNGSCVSSDEIKINNNRVNATAGSKQEICASETYLSGDQAIAGGYGLWKLVSGGGTISEPSKYNTKVTGINEGMNTYRWTVYENGCSNEGLPGSIVSIINNSFSVNAGLDQDLLANNTQLEGRFPAGSSDATGMWTIMSGFGTFTPNPPGVEDPLVSDLLSGYNTFRWTVEWQKPGSAVACSGYDDVTILYKDFSPYAGENSTVCKSSTQLAALDIADASSKKWTVTEGSGIFENDQNPLTSVSGLSLGNNTFRFTVVKNGYEAFDEVTITYAVFEKNAGVDTEICENVYTLQGESPGSTGVGVWSQTGGPSVTFSNKALYNTGITGLNPGEYRFLWSVVDGVCSTSDEVKITYTYFETDAGIDTEQCKDTYIMQGESPGSTGVGKWTHIRSSGGVFSNNAQYNSVITGLNPGENKFSWTVVKGACSASDDVIINYKKVTADAGIDKKVEKESVNLSANTPLEGHGVWSIKSGSGTFSSNSYNAILADLKIGTTIATWTIFNGSCSDSDDVTITRVLSSFTINGKIVISNLPPGTAISGFIYLFLSTNNKTGEGAVYKIPVSADGTYSMEGIAEGDYKILVAIDGYKPTWYGNTTNEAESTISKINNNFVDINIEVSEKAVGIDYLLKTSELKYYPIPVKEILYVELPENTSDVSIKILDIKGQLVMDKCETTSDNILKLNIQELRQGIYFLKIWSVNGNYSVKFIK